MIKIFVNIIFVMVLAFLTGCTNDKGKKFIERMGMEGDQYTTFVVALDYGCHTCKDRFYEFVITDWPESSALVFKRKPYKATLKGFPELFERDFVFVDSLDISFELGLTDKNTEMTLIKEGKVTHYTFLEYINLIEELKKN